MAARVAAGLLVLQALVLLGRPWVTPPQLVLDVAVGLVGLALVPLLLRRPVVAAVLLGALAVTSPVATPAATAAALTVARYRPFRSSMAVAAVGIGGHLVLGLWRPHPGLTYGWWVFLVVVAYATLIGWGAYLRARRTLLDSFRERAERAEAEQARKVVEARRAERLRIAREMHDVLGHRLSLVVTHAGALEYRPDAAPERIATAARVVREGVHQALAELREVILVLREEDEPAVGEHDEPPQPTLADLPGLLAENRAAGARVDVTDPTPDLASLPATTGRTAYRIVQEGLTNARRHAPGQPVTVTFAGAAGGDLEIRVSNRLEPDDPAGRATDGAADRTGGMGLVGLAERVELAGGGLTHGWSAGTFELVARLPWAG